MELPEACVGEAWRDPGQECKCHPNPPNLNPRSLRLIPEGYLLRSQKNHPRGFRPVYTPCLDSKCQALLKEYEESEDPDVADLLIESLDRNRRERWEQNTASMSFARSTRMSWSMIRRLGAAQQPTKAAHAQISPNAVASHLLKVAKSPTKKSRRRQTRDEWRQHCRKQRSSGRQHEFVDFDSEELRTVIQSIRLRRDMTTCYRNS